MDQENHGKSEFTIGETLQAKIGHLLEQFVFH